MQAVKLEPGDATSYFHIAGIYHNSGSPSQAIDSYKQTIAIDPTFIEAYVNLGNALEELQNTEDAIEAYKKAISIDINLEDPEDQSGS